MKPNTFLKFKMAPKVQKNDRNVAIGMILSGNCWKIMQDGLMFERITHLVR